MGLVIEIQLDSNLNALTQSAPNTDGAYSVSDVAYVGQVVEMDSLFNDSFSKMLNDQGGVQFHGQTMRQHSYSFTGGVTSAEIPVTERSKSIKSPHR
jgi:hypothetical protein